MSSSFTDRIEKRIVLRAPIACVWRALTNEEEFGSWFGVKLADRFQPGAPAQGQITSPGYEHVAIPLERRALAFQMNEGGWAAQLLSIERHVGATG